MKKLLLIILTITVLISCKKQDNKPDESNNTITPYDSSANFTGKGGNVCFVIQQHCDSYIDIPAPNVKVSLYLNIDSLSNNKPISILTTASNGKVQYNGIIARNYYYKAVGNINNGTCIKQNAILTGLITIKKGILNTYNLILK